MARKPQSRWEDWAETWDAFLTDGGYRAYRWSLDVPYRERVGHVREDGYIHSCNYLGNDSLSLSKLICMANEDGVELGEFTYTSYFNTLPGGIKFVTVLHFKEQDAALYAAMVLAE